MSRAFVKESDAVEELPELPVSEERNLVTERGLAQIEAQVARLTKALQKAGDDRHEIARLARDLRYWSARRASAEPVPPQKDISKVRFGLQATLERNGRKETFRIVGQDEADPEKGLLSYVSPLARALIGKEVGDIIRVGGAAEIVAIEA